MGGKPAAMGSNDRLKRFSAYRQNFTLLSASYICEYLDCWSHKTNNLKTSNISHFTHQMINGENKLQIY